MPKINKYLSFKINQLNLNLWFINSQTPTSPTTTTSAITPAISAVWRLFLSFRFQFNELFILSIIVTFSWLKIKQHLISYIIRVIMTYPSEAIIHIGIIIINRVLVISLLSFILTDSGLSIFNIDLFISINSPLADWAFSLTRPNLFIETNQMVFVTAIQYISVHSIII